MARPPKILVVDDDHLIRMMFDRLAAKFEVDVSCVASPQEARVLLDKHAEYDLCFLDMRFNTPQQDGMVLLRLINARDLDLHVVIMSGSINLHDVMGEANRLGVVSFMVKPIDFTTDFLVVILRRLGLKLVLREVLEEDSPLTDRNLGESI